MSLEKNVPVRHLRGEGESSSEIKKAGIIPDELMSAFLNDVLSPVFQSLRIAHSLPLSM
jgi:hypothetical protein